MHGICGLTDFTRKEMCGGENIAGNRHSGEHALFIQPGGESPVHRTVEGYDFSIAFCGTLCKRKEHISELKSFGYKLITDTDAETVLYMYIHYGEKCAEKLRGNFAFAVNDCMRRRVFLCCRGQDLTYMRSETAVLFSTDERLLFKMADKPVQIGTDGLQRIFYDGCDCGVLKNVFVLPEEHFMIISRRGISVKQYADMPEADTREAEKIFPLFSAFLKPIVSDTLSVSDANPDYNAFMRRRNARITDIFDSPCQFENGNYSDMLRRGLIGVIKDEASPLTALCDTDRLLNYISSSEFSTLAAEFLIKINKLLEGVRIV